MTRIRRFLILTFLIPINCFAQQSASTLDGIDYGQYVATPGLFDLDSLQRHAHSLDSQNFDTRAHLEKLYSVHFDKSPINTKDLPKLSGEVGLGTDMMNAENMNVQILADMLLQALSDSVQNGLNSEYLDKKNPELLDVIDQLRAAQYSVSIPVSDKEKFIMNVKQGNFSYVFTRFKTRCILDCSNGLCEPMCRWFWALSLVGLVLLILLIIYRKRIRLFSRLRRSSKP